MTREEIAKWLKGLKGDIGKSENQPLWHYAEVLDIAIEALQKPPISQRRMYQLGYRQGREDRPRGHWIDGKWCSVCGTPIATDVWGTSVDESEVHYCIECGADMRGGERSEYCEHAKNPSGDIWECDCFIDTYCEHQIYDRDPDGTLNIVKCGERSE